MNDRSFRWIPFVGFASLPDFIVDMMGLDEDYVWKTFMISWLRWHICIGLEQGAKKAGAL